MDVELEKSLSSQEDVKRVEKPQKKNITNKGRSGIMIDHIPCLFLPCDEAATKVLLYFHANAEDIGLAFDLLHAMGQRLSMHVIAVEYPGYGLYKTSKPNEE